MTDLEELAERVAKLEEERDAYHKLYLDMLERCRKLERGLRGQPAERLSPNDEQLSLAMLGMMLTNDHQVPPEEPKRERYRVPEHERRKPKRNPLPDDLPRVDVVVLPYEVEREGLDAFEQIGQEVTETLERRPSSVVVVRTFKPKYVRKDRDKKGETTVYVAKSHPLPIPRGLAGPGMLADSIVKRWEDHLPLNRLERVYGRDGVQLARSTLCGWHIALAELARPVVDAMRLDAFDQPYLCTDATGVLVQAKEKCRTGHFWVMVAPERHVLFEFTKRHDSAAVDDVLAGYEGFLVADAHAVYDHLYGESVTEVNCWAHTRRYFFKAMSSDPERARAALGLINALFRIERSIADRPRKQKEKIRKKRSKPIVDAFYSWCDAEKDQVLDDTPISKGIGYAVNQRKGLLRFLQDGRLPLHNNMSELQLRRQAVGRKNWLFIGSDDGALANTTFVSLLASCRMHDVEPWSYLRDLFCLLPTWPQHRLLELAPLNWKATVELPEVKQVLAANPYRAATLLPATSA